LAVEPSMIMDKDAKALLVRKARFRRDAVLDVL
jgi:hypothetical protein